LLLSLYIFSSNFTKIQNEHFLLNPTHGSITLKRPILTEWGHFCWETTFLKVKTF
jgi:hypothetical protein